MTGHSFYPGQVCVLRAAGQTIRVRVRYVVSPGRIKVAWVDRLVRSSGWEPPSPIVRAARLRPVEH